MVTLILEAGRIPDGTVVHKPTGEKQYTLRKELRVYLPDNDRRPVTFPDVVFLVGDSYVNGVYPTTKLAVDFDDEDEAIEFLTELAKTAERKSSQ